MTPNDELLARLDSISGPGYDLPGLAAAAIRDLTAKLEAWQELSDHVTISPTGIYPGRYTDPAVQRVAQWIKDAEAKLEAETKRHRYYAAAFGATCEKHSHDEIPSACVFCALEAERKARDEVERKYREELNYKLILRAEKAESALAAVFEETRKAIGLVYLALDIASTAHRGQDEWNQISNLKAIADGMNSELRALAPEESAQVPQ